MNWKRTIAALLTLVMTLQVLPVLASEPRMPMEDRKDLVETSISDPEEALKLGYMPAEEQAASLLANEPQQTFLPYPGAQYELKYLENPDGTLKITGCLGEKTGNLVVPGEINGKKVTIIGDHAFWGGDHFTGELLIPDGITVIEDAAFQGCHGLTGGLRIPDSVTTVGAMSFWHCDGLTGPLTIGSGLQSIGDAALCGYGGEAIVVSDANSAYTARDGILYTKDLSSLIVCPAGKQGTVVLPDSVVTISKSAFEYCSHLTGTIQIGKNVTEIGRTAFSGCGASALAAAPENSVYASKDGILFSKDFTTVIACPTGKAGILTLPETVKTISVCAFLNCTQLTGELQLPQGLDVIDWSAFGGCSGLTGSLVIPDGVSKIGTTAFADCTGLGYQVEIPASVNEIDMAAFSGCSGISDALFLGNAPATFGAMVFRNCAPNFSISYMPGTTGWTDSPQYDIYAGTWRGYPIAEKKPTYQPDPTASYSLTYEQLPDGTIQITGYRGEAAGTLLLPDSIDGKPVTAIADWAFSKCAFTGPLNLPKDLVSIGRYAFYYCTGFTGSLVLPEKVTTIGESAFHDCEGISGTITIGSSVASIGGCAFSSLDCRSLILSEGNSNYQLIDGMLVSADGTRLVYCPSGKRGPLTIPQSITHIEAGAFYLCYDLTGPLVLPENLQSIGDYAFFLCVKLEGDLKIPSHVTRIGNDTFAYCDRLTGTAYLPAGVTQVEGGAFRGSDFSRFEVAPGNNHLQVIQGMLYTDNGTRLLACPEGITGPISLPEGTQIIELGAFEERESLSGSVYLPASLTQLEDLAFMNCTHLSKVYFKGNAPSLQYSVFDGCAADFTIYYASGTTGWTDSPNYDAAAGTWNGYPLKSWDPAAEKQVTLDATTYNPDTREIVVPAMPDTVQAVLAAYLHGQLQEVFTASGSPDGNRWVIPEQIQYDELKVFAYNADPQPLCTFWGTP